jgi:hypothetical protein
MASTNGQANQCVPEGAPFIKPVVKPATPKVVVRRTTAKMRKAMAELEVPFDPESIEWRIGRIEREPERRKGLVLPYADPRAYTDRLNALFSPAGWTRSYTVHTSANFERSRDRKMVAKVFVTCDLRIFGLGAHSATGEEWADYDNAGTSAEAQAFKRACSCFGLGRYLYSFGAIWVELDERNRAKESPVLTGWATPAGWREGLRPGGEASGVVLQQVIAADAPEEKNAVLKDAEEQERQRLVTEIAAMAEPLGRRLYRGVLKSVAMAWKPEDVRELSVLERLLREMRSAQEELDKLRAITAENGSECLGKVLYSFAMRSLNEVTTPERLQAIVAAVEGECARSRGAQL